MPTELQPENFLGRTGVIVNLAQGVGGEFNEGLDTCSSIENVTGSNFKDALIGDANVNVLRGMDGDDMIEGGAGGDTLDGGAGSDTLSYFGSNARVVVNLQTGAASGGHAAGDVISLFENLGRHGRLVRGRRGGLITPASQANAAGNPSARPHSVIRRRSLPPKSYTHQNVSALIGVRPLADLQAVVYFGAGLGWHLESRIAFRR